MLKREYIFYLEDMLQSMQKIEGYIQDINFSEFIKKDMVIDAVIRNFEIIGEAAKNLPNDYYLRYPEIPWTKMYRLRNIVIHHYHGIDYEMIWEISKNNLPQNKIDLIKVIESEKNIKT